MATIEGSAIAEVLRTSTLLYPATSAFHVLGIALLIGSIIALDVRVVGIWRGAGWRQAVSDLVPVAAIGLGLAAVTGAALFSVRAGEYIVNPAMLAKWVLIALGLINVVVFHALMRRAAHRDSLPSRSLRIVAGVSALTWIAAVFAGRWIAFAN